MKYLIFAALLPLSAFATEAQLGCNLERSKAEVQARLLEAPEAFGQAGVDPATGQKNVTLGVSQSLRGGTRASKLRDSAEAQCDALRATVAIETYGRSATTKVLKDGAIVELRNIERAILLAKENIAQLDVQLAAGTITINQHSDARQVLMQLQTRQADLLRILSRAVEPTEPIVALLDVARVAEGRAARLAAEAVAERGWDVKVTGGARQPINGGNAQTFGTVTFTYSFGYNGARDAAARVGRDTENYLAAQGGGYTQTLLRQQQELKGLYDAEVLAQANTARERVHLQKVRASLVGLDTVLALNTIRTLDIQLLSLVAQEQGAGVRAAGYRRLLDDLK